MLHVLRILLALGVVLGLAACGGGGGDSTTTTITGSGVNSLGQSPAVSTHAVQTDNNLLVSVSDGPRGFQLAPNANILYATVTVCSPINPTQCVSIDHVQVDTGSVGLRVLASAVKGLNLPPVEISSAPNPVLNAWECFPFVIGGLWGANAKAVIQLGRQQTGVVAVQLIEDNPSAALQANANCQTAADNMILSSAGALGSNGILGIGSTNLDCGSVCLTGSYAANATFVQYYGCPTSATSTAACSSTAPVAANLQVSNPVSAFTNSAYRGGVVLVMPAVTDPGAATASGELIFGVDTVSGGASLSNNMVPAGIKKVLLGVDVNNMPAYLNITTQLRPGASVQTFASSYLDTGTNGLFFLDSSAAPITRCVGSTWYCPKSTLTLDAVLSDGGGTLQNAVAVQFQVGNAEALFSTSNTAFSDAAGAPPVGPNGSAAFAWGMPFFYGRRVYMSIWDITGAVVAPWYAWSAL
jgi:hypothetical protein